MASPTDGKFSPGQFFGWAVGGAVGSVPLLSFQVYVLIQPGRISDRVIAWATIDLALMGGFLGGGLGYVFAYIFDAPLFNKREVRASLLFALTFTLLFYSVLSFPMLSFIQAGPEERMFILSAIAFIASFASGCLKGVLNNLKTEGRYPFDKDEGKKLKP